MQNYYFSEKHTKDFVNKRKYNYVTKNNKKENIKIAFIYDYLQKIIYTQIYILSHFA